MQHFAADYDDECSFIQSFSDLESECEDSTIVSNEYQYGPSYFSALAEDDITIGTTQTDSTFHTYLTNFSEFSEFTEQSAKTDFSDASSSIMTGKSTSTGLSRKSKRKAELARRIAQEMKNLSIEELSMLVKSGKMTKHKPELETLAEEDSLTDDDNPSIAESSYSTENEANFTKSTEDISSSEYFNSSSIEESWYSSDDQVTTQTFSDDLDEVSQSYSNEPTLSYDSSHSEMQNSTFTETEEYKGLLSLFKFKPPPRRSKNSKKRDSYHVSSDEYDERTVTSESNSDSYSDSYSESNYTEEETTCGDDIKNVAPSNDSMHYVSSGLKSNEEFYSAVSSNDHSEYRNRGRDRYDVKLETDLFFTIDTPRHCNVNKKANPQSFESWYSLETDENAMNVEIVTNNSCQQETVEMCLVEPPRKEQQELGIQSKKSFASDSNSIFPHTIKRSSSKQADFSFVQALESKKYQEKSCSISISTDRVKDPVEEFRNARSESELSYEGNDSVVFSYDQEDLESSSKDKSICMEDIIKLVREKKLEIDKGCEDIYSDDDLEYGSDKDQVSRSMTTILGEYENQSVTLNKDQKSEDAVIELQTSSIDLIGMKDLMSQINESEKLQPRAAAFHEDVLSIKYGGSLENEMIAQRPSRRNSEKSKVSDTLAETSPVDLFGAKDVVVSNIQGRQSTSFRTDESSISSSITKKHSMSQESLKKNDSIADSVKTSTSVDLIGIKDLMKQVEDQNPSKATPRYSSSSSSSSSIQTDNFLQQIKPVRHETVEAPSNIQVDDSETTVNIEEDDDDIYGINHLVQLVKGQKD